MSRGVSCLHHLYHPCSNKKKQNGGSQVPAYPGRPENGCLTSVVVVVSCRENGALHSVLVMLRFPFLHMKSHVNLLKVQCRVMQTLGAQMYCLKILKGPPLPSVKCGVMLA